MISEDTYCSDIQHVVLKYASDCDYCDLRFGTTIMISLSMLNDQVTQATTQRNRGFFARAKIHDKWGDYFVPSMDLRTGSRALSLAISAARGVRRELVGKLSDFADGGDTFDNRKLAGSLKSGIKALLKRGLDCRVQYSRRYVDEVITTIDGHQSCYQESHVLIMVRLAACGPRGPVTVNGQIAKRGQEPWYPEDLAWLGTNLLARIEEVKLRDEAPSGSFPLILDSNIGAILAHEIFGHGLEADFILESQSPFTGKLGEQVTQHGVTVLDRGNASWGLVRYDRDEEGTGASRTVLIEGGYLVNLIHSRKTAHEFDCLPTGNGRAGGIDKSPIPRISNLQVLPGTASLQEVLKDIRVGIYAEGALGEAFFFPERGLYWVEAESGYLIENGVITRPLSSIAITGTVAELLRDLVVIRVDDFDTLPGFCLKRQQYVPVDVQCPPLYIGRTTISPIE